ncbi:MAG TPA: DUF2914 domain-containing protein [Gammaproteobacteria bacterium]
MRQILMTAVLLGLPLAAAAQEEPQTTQTQYGQDQQQAQDTRTQQDQQSQSQQQQGMQASTEAGAEPEVARAQFTSKVENREPVDEVSQEFQAEQEPLYFFTEVKNAAGETITHRWMHNGEVVAEVPLQVGSDSWRTWSSKEFIPEWEGEWTVEVVDSQGNTLVEESVTVQTQQMQNVGYSPDQGQQGQQQQDQQQMQDQSGMQSEPIESEQIDYEQSGQQSEDMQQQSDDTQMQDMQTQEDQTEIDYVPPTEETQSEDGTQQQEDDSSIGQDY